MALWLIRKMISKNSNNSVCSKYWIDYRSSIYLYSMNPHLTDEETEASKVSATWQVGHCNWESNPGLSGFNTQALYNLERPDSYPGRFIWGSFLGQEHSAPTTSLLKTAISGAETSIFQTGRLTLETRHQARACHPPRPPPQSQLWRCWLQGRQWMRQPARKSEEKNVASLGRQSGFSSVHQSQILFLVTSHSTFIGSWNLHWKFHWKLPS